MYDTPLLETCGIAFAVVFGLLTVLAIIIHLITAVFPANETKSEPEPEASAPPAVAQTETDLAVLVAIASAVSTMIPGATVTCVEEERS